MFRTVRLVRKKANVGRLQRWIKALSCLQPVLIGAVLSVTTHLSSSPHFWQEVAMGLLLHIESCMTRSANDSVKEPPAKGGFLLYDA